MNYKTNIFAHLNYFICKNKMALQSNYLAGFSSFFFENKWIPNQQNENLPKKKKYVRNILIA